MEKISNKQIAEIADSIDAGDICFINKDTGELIFMMSNEMLSYHGISWEDDFDEEEEDEEFDVASNWQDELYTQVKADMAKIYSWEHVIRIEKPDSRKGFEIMERFVKEVIPEGKLKDRFWNALSKSHPFRNFNNVVHNCELREDWFEFKQNALEEYVRGILERM